jgi:hypothetical protein
METATLLNRSIVELEYATSKSSDGNPDADEDFDIRVEAQGFTDESGRNEGGIGREKMRPKD